MALTVGFLGRGAAGTPGWLEQTICAFIKPVLLLRTMLESVNSACDFYWLFQSDSFTNKTVYWSRMYAVQKGYNKPLEQLSRKTYGRITKKKNFWHCYRPLHICLKIIHCY
jgi:hypothetical protein